MSALWSKSPQNTFHLSAPLWDWEHAQVSKAAEELGLTIQAYVRHCVGLDPELRSSAALFGSKPMRVR
jgi:hypothetical protein